MFQTLLIISSIVTAISYFMFGFYCIFFAHTPGLDWVPPFFLTAITFSGCMGVIPIPYIMTIEILPSKVSLHPICPCFKFHFWEFYSFFNFKFADSVNLLSSHYFSRLATFLRRRIIVSNHTRAIWSSYVSLYIR